MISDNYEKHWTAKILDYDYPLTEKQYRIFCHGFSPDWDHRYESVSVDGWHYVYRSGRWIEKFRYVKQKDGLFHITEHYVKGDEKSYLDEVLFHGGWETPLFTDEEIMVHVAKMKK